MEQIPDTEKFIDQVCLSYRHDFGFMDKTQQNRLRFECKEWIRAINSNTKTKPSLGQISDNPPPPPPLAEPPGFFPYPVGNDGKSGQALNFPMFIVHLAKAVLSRWFFSPINVFYCCLEKQNYVTITLTQLFTGGQLSIGNGMDIKEKCKKVGVLVAEENVYGYATFKYGYLLFGGSLKQTHFGYSLFESKTEKSSTRVSTFCNYIPFSEQSLKQKIHLLKYGSCKSKN